jgi:two-component system cell cycle sensor histidine kinase/response regulator CckA
MDEPARIRQQLRSIDDPAALLASVFAQAPIGLQVYKADGHCLFVNHAFRDLFGTEPPPEYNVLRDEMAAKQGVLGLIHRALAGETVGIGPIWYDARGLEQAKAGAGRRFAIETVAFPLIDASGGVAHVGLTFRDVTAETRLRDERHQLEALHRTEEQLRQSQKLEAVGKLAGGIAHDFNNLLSVILSYTGLAVESLKPDDPMRADLDEAKRAGERAAELTRQLLAFSRQQVLQPKIVDLNSTLLDMQKLLGRLLGEDVELSIVNASRLGSIHADPGQLEQLVMNLVINARDAMPGGGKLTIETANVELDAAYAAEHLGLSPGPHVMLAVTDTGVGMDAATRAHLFEPFFTTKEKGRGTGLGLSTVFGIVNQSGGSIWVDSQLNAGTTFRIYFPRTAVSQDVVEPSMPPKAANLGGSETILLVEDEEQVRVLARTLLRRYGYNVLEAANAGEAFLLCEQHQAEIHLLMTDVVMPRMSGRQLADRLARERPGLKILYMSGYTDDSMLQRGVFDAGVSFLQKPITPTALVLKVREVLDSGS